VKNRRSLRSSHAVGALDERVSWLDHMTRPDRVSTSVMVARMP
jgi:hypothetical protein